MDKIAGWNVRNSVAPADKDALIWNAAAGLWLPGAPTPAVHTHSHDTGLTDVSANDHHNQAHAVAGGDHSASGLVAGQVLRASGATTFTWAQLAFSDLSGSLAHSSLASISANDHHNQAHAISGADHTGTLAHSALGSVGANDHHNQSHTLTGADHSGNLTQARSHDTPDTDSATSSLHHTIGASGTQAAAGNHTHSALPSVARKSADESVTSSTALQDDDHLVFAIGANEKAAADFHLYVNPSAPPGGLKVAITVPSGATLLVMAVAVATGGATPSFGAGETTTSGAALSMAGSGNLSQVHLHVIVINGSTPGNVQLQWAQSTSDVTATTLKANSYLVATKF